MSACRLPAAAPGRRSSSAAIDKTQRNSDLLPNKLPETPVNQEIGNLSGGSAATSEPAADSPTAAEALAAEEVAARAAPGAAAANPVGEARISCHEAEKTGNQDHVSVIRTATPAPDHPTRTPTGCDPLADLLDAAQVRRGLFRRSQISRNFFCSITGCSLLRVLRNERFRCIHGSLRHFVVCHESRFV